MDPLDYTVEFGEPQYGARESLNIKAEAAIDGSTQLTLRVPDVGGSHLEKFEVFRTDNGVKVIYYTKDFGSLAHEEFIQQYDFKFPALQFDPQMTYAVENKHTSESATEDNK